MEEIWEVFIRQFYLKGPVKIPYFDPKYVYIDVPNDVDYKHFIFKEYVDISDSPIKFMKYTPDFIPEVETSIIQVWILIHQLPWHLIK